MDGYSSWGSDRFGRVRVSGVGNSRPFLAVHVAPATPCWAPWFPWHHPQQIRHQVVWHPVFLGASWMMAGPQVIEASKGSCTKSNTRFLVRVSPEVTVLREISPVTSWTATAINIKCDIMACVSVISDYIYRTQLKGFLMQDRVKLTSQLIAVFHHSLGRVTEKGECLLFTLPFQ